MCARLAPAASRVASKRLVRPRFPAAAAAAVARQARRQPPQLGESGNVQVAVQRLEKASAPARSSAPAAPAALERCEPTTLPPSETS